MEISAAFERDIERFLYREAALLDKREFDRWLELLTQDVIYEMPVRFTAARDAREPAAEGVHFAEDRRTLELRVQRLKTDSAWAENPPSRTRRFVSNVCVEPGARAGEVTARSYLLLYRSRASAPEPDLVSAERVDVLRNVAGQWKVAKRSIVVDQAVLGTQNLAVFF